ncbi:MAG: ArsR family transcriptional regulator [Defluviitaleaceae bacterium]|nr:ArsR family transcriptional regulator [Defluviitaleaceae bacterium]
MDRNYSNEIDEINVQLGEIKTMLAQLTKQPHTKARTRPLKNIELPVWNEDTDKRLVELQEELCQMTDEKGSTGYVTYVGVYSSSNRQSNWISKTNIDKLLELIQSNIAAKVLACIGNNDRLNMLLALLRSPMTVAQLVEECGYNTTGQVYHHLKPLLAADLVKEDEQHGRGSYVMQPHRVQGVIMLLVGISDMLDTEFSQGSWDE